MGLHQVPGDDHHVRPDPDAREVRGELGPREDRVQSAGDALPDERGQVRRLRVRAVLPGVNDKFHGSQEATPRVDDSSCESVWSSLDVCA